MPSMAFKCIKNIFILFTSFLDTDILRFKFHDLPLMILCILPSLSTLISHNDLEKTPMMVRLKMTTWYWLYLLSISLSPRAQWKPFDQQFDFLVGCVYANLTIEDTKWKRKVLKYKNNIFLISFTIDSEEIFGKIIDTFGKGTLIKETFWPHRNLYQSREHASKNKLWYFHTGFTCTFSQLIKTLRV